MNKHTLIELSRIEQIMYMDPDAPGQYHLDIHTLLDFDGTEVVTVFQVSKGNLPAIGLDIPDDFPVTVKDANTDKTLMYTTFGELS